MVDPAGNGPGDRTIIANTVFMSSYAVGEAQTFEYTGSAGAEYEVVDYYGNTVISRQALPPSPFTLPVVLPLGWYKIYLYRAVFVAVPWGPAAGSKTFCVVRASSPLISRPSPTATRNYMTNEFGLHIPARGYFGVGPSRHKVDNLSTTAQAAGLAQDVTHEFNSRAADSARPQPQLVVFPNGYQGQAANAAVYAQAACNATGASPTTWFEGANEPNVTTAAATYATEQIGFADAIHAGHANARVIGPCTVSIYGDKDSDGGGSLRWFNNFCVAMGANLSKLDGISFHNYDNPTGNLDANRKVFDKWVALLTQYGQQNKPRWNTEFGSIWSAAAGVFMAQYQARNTMLELMLHEQYLIPKERTCIFYDVSHGFWGFPSFWIMAENGSTDFNITPLAPLMRVWAEELFGKNFSTKLDFGSENSVYIGSRFTGSDGSSVLAIQSGYGHPGLVTFTLTGATSVVKCDPWGNLSTIQRQTDGTFTVLIDELVTYLRCPSGVTATPVAINYGIDVSKAVVTSFANTTSNPGTAYLAAAGDMTGSPPSGTWIPSDIYQNDWKSASPPQVIYQEDYSRPAFINKIVVTAPYPANDTSTLIQFDLEGKGIITPGVWTVFATWTEDTTKQEIHTGANDVGGCYVDTYFRFRNQWVYRADPAMKFDGLRVTMKKTTFGQRPTPETWNRQYLTMTGNPTGGTFTLTWNGITTAPIPYNATPAQILAALQATPGGSVWVSTITGSTLALGVTLSSSAIWPLTANSAGLTGGSSPTVNVSIPGGTNTGGDFYLSGPQKPQLRQLQVFLNEYDLGKTQYVPLYPAV